MLTAATQEREHSAQPLSQAAAAPAPVLIESLAARLLRRVFGGFFAVTALLVCGQLVFEYRHAERRLLEDISALDGTFGRGIAEARWGLNDDVLHGILSGMHHLPEIVGVKVVDEHNNLVQAVGTIIDDAGGVWTTDDSAGGLAAAPRSGLLNSIIGRTFDTTHYDNQSNRHVIGQWTVYTTREFILSEVEQQFTVVCVIAIIKTVSLWVIFMVVIRRVIGRPLQQLSAFVAQLNIDNLGTRPFVLRDPGRHELHILANMLNLMTEKIRRSVQNNVSLMQELKDLNASLQSKVAERTGELERLATLDSLTGLVNRRKIEELLGTELNQLERGRKDLSVILMDLDHFKSVNDAHGHQAGDLVLVTVSRILSGLTRATDTAGRWGGEEFMVVCTNTSLDNAMLVAERQRQAIAAIELPGIGRQTCSFGVAQLAAGETSDSMIARADLALYRAKNGGRNRAVAAG